MFKLDFLIADNPYASTPYFARCFAKALRKLGIRVRLFYIGKGNFYKAFYAISQDPPHATCSFSDLFLGDKQPIGDFWRIPHFSFFLDPCVYFLHQLQGNYGYVSCVDEGDLAFLQSRGFSRSFFLPHGVDASLVDDEEEKLYPVTLLGSCIDYLEVEKVWTRFSKEHRDILKECAEKVLSPSGPSCLEALLEMNVGNDLCWLHHELDLYITGKDRVELVRSLGNLDVHIWGKGPWKKYCPNAHLHGPIRFTQSLKVIRKSQILLSSSPRFKKGSHERMFHGPALGALVVTGDNSYLRSYFTDQKSVLTYTHGVWDEVPEKILPLLENPKARKQIVREGYQTVLNHHTWDVRARILFDFLQNSIL